VDGIDLVIHADPPAEHKAYVHRSGRTARAGAGGVVVTLQTEAQARDVRALMRKAGVTPRTAAVHPGSAVLRSIAGPPVARVTPLARPSRPTAPAGGARSRRGGGRPAQAGKAPGRGARFGSGQTRRPRMR
jgi:superfamily II DNA/RNA helicase